MSARMPTDSSLTLTADPLLDDLTDAQRDAVAHVDGPLLVLAGAGSGKTRVITRRIAHLVLRVGLAPWNILAITFTNKAAGEMRERVAQVVSERQARAVTVATFHSLCARTLRRYCDEAELPPGFSIYDAGDQQRAMKRVLERLEMSTSHFPPGKMLGTISKAKQDLLDADAFAQTAGDFYTRNAAKVYKAYEAMLRENHALDFDDLLLRTVRLMRDNADVLKEMRERYQYVLIDEYQDTNHAQFLIAHALSAEHQNICATGDPDQSIYRWRGADISNILEFEEHFPNANVVRLEQSYRSTKRICAAADALIQHNKQRKHKSMWTENEEGDPIKVVTCNDERHEARWIVERMRDLQEKQDIPWSGMAVFYRINSPSRVIEDALREASVPYQIARGTSFYERKEIKDAVAYLRVVANPADEVNLLRVINTPARGISNNTVKALQAFGVSNQMSFDMAMRQAANVPGLNTRAVSSVNKFVAAVDRWRAIAGIDLSVTPPSDAPASLRGFVELMLRESSLHEHYANDKSDPDQERLANLGELVSAAQQFEAEFEAGADVESMPEGFPDDPFSFGGATPLAEKLLGYLERISLVADVDAIDTGHGAVTLMTLHAAKGLEFPVVAILVVEDGLLPHERANESRAELEEERRLCFVGITRAMRFLSLSHARYRTVFGRTTPTIPSRFIEELPQDGLEMIHAEGEDVGWGDDAQPSFGTGRSLSASSPTPAPSRRSAFTPGLLVRHDKFGLGRVIGVKSSTGGTRIQVQFNTAGVKTLVQEYANLQIVDV